MLLKSFLLPLAAAALTSAAAMPAAAEVVVTDPWVRGTVPNQRSTGVFMQLKSSTDTTLVGVASPAAKVVQIHEMKLENQVMMMKTLEKLPLPAGQAVDLKPGGYHVMLMDLTQLLKDGETVPLTLTIADKAGKTQTMEVKVPVRKLTTSTPPAKAP